MKNEQAIKPKFLDILIFLLALAAIGITAVNVYASGGGRKVVHVKASSGEWILPLEGTHHLSVEGPLGTTRIRISDGAAWTVSSPCPEKICIKSGKISRPGQWLACLPNQVFIAVEGRAAEEPDATSF